MIDVFILSFPVIVTIAMLLLLVFTGINTRQKKYFVFFLAVMSIFLSMEGVYTEKDIDYSVLANTYLIAQLAAPCILPSVWMLYNTVRNDNRPHFLSRFWLVFPIILFLICIVVRYLLGTDNVVAFHRAMDFSTSIPAQFSDRIYMVYYFSSFIIFYLIIAAEVLTFSIYIIVDMVKSKFSLKSVLGFFFTGQSASTVHILQFVFILAMPVSLVRSLMSRQLVFSYPALEYAYCLTMGIGIIFLTYIVLFSHNEALSFKQMRDSFTFGTVTEVTDSENFIAEDEVSDLVNLQFTEPVREPVAEHPSAVKKDYEEVIVDKLAVQVPEKPKAPSVMSSAQVAFIVKEETEDDSSLSARFEHLMFKDQVFLTPGLTVFDVADKLKTNKTYISRLVNNNYGMSFPDFINSLRIDYAEQYILHNTNAKQKIVAEACGFPSASALNNTFKKITGLTPKVWLAQNQAHK